MKKKKKKDLKFDELLELDKENKLTPEQKLDLDKELEERKQNKKESINSMTRKKRYRIKNHIGFIDIRTYKKDEVEKFRIKLHSIKNDFFQILKEMDEDSRMDFSDDLKDNLKRMRSKEQPSKIRRSIDKVIREIEEATSEGNSLLVTDPINPNENQYPDIFTSGEACEVFMTLREIIGKKDADYSFYYYKFKEHNLFKKNIGTKVYMDFVAEKLGEAIGQIKYTDRFSESKNNMFNHFFEKNKIKLSEETKAK